MCTRMVMAVSVKNMRWVLDILKVRCSTQHQVMMSIRQLICKSGQILGEIQMEVKSDTKAEGETRVAKGTPV